MDMILSGCLNAANEMTQYGSFALARWVLSCFTAVLPTKVNVSM